MSNIGGYGAAGHKNRYNYRVRLDNWVRSSPSAANEADAWVLMRKNNIMTLQPRV